MEAVTYSGFRKFNQYHDARGRFTTATGGTGPARSANFKAINEKAAKKMRKAMGQDMDPYFDNDAKVMKNPNTGYFGTRNSFDINQKLRKGESLTLEEQKTVDTMDRKMSETTEDITVTRWAGNSFLESIVGAPIYTRKTGFMKTDEISERIVGGVVKERSYVSTSYDESKNKFSSRGIKIELNVPKGTKALFSPTDDEAELVLHKGTSYRIDSVREENYNIIIRGTVIE